MLIVFILPPPLFLATSAKQYEDGISYQYKYNAAVLFNEPPPLSAANSSRTKGSDVGYQVIILQHILFHLMFITLI